MNRTIVALISRGLDSERAAALASAGWTVSKLKMTDGSSLRELGLTDEQIGMVQEGSRPRIPHDVVTKLLFDNRYQCCVCRDSKLAYIVHHIVAWSKSKSHDFSNLAVLCLQHHSDAHSTGDLKQNLTERMLKDAKSFWESKVKDLDSRAVINSLKADYSHWAFINEMRMLELMNDHQISFKSSKYYKSAIANEIIDRFGVPLPVRTASYYMYEGPSILTRYFFMSDLLSKVIELLPIINISDYLDKGTLLPSILSGDFIIVQGAHTFSPLTKVSKGIGQHCRASRQANGVRLEFTFDRWMATSSSSINDWLSGTKSATSLVQVKSIARVDGTVVLTGTVIAIASFAENLKTRDYSTKWQEWMPRTRNRSLT